MRSNSHDRVRRSGSFQRGQAKQPPYDRILIVCEGEKTEPNYFEEIKHELRLPTAAVAVVRGDRRTEPLQIVTRAEDKFKEGRAFEQVYVIFDRDEHRTYLDAIARCEALKLRNDEGRIVDFTPIVSVPLFELWLLLHFEHVENFAARQDLVKRLERYIQGYDKGMHGTYAVTRERLEQARNRAGRLRNRFTSASGEDPWTNVDLIVDRLTKLRAPA